jgi:YD repeat-containing protein
MRIVSCIVSVLLTFAAYANVSLKNGNFSIGYTDIAYNGGMEPKVERVYNSKTGFLGMFGWGWGWEYEVYLKVAGDGTVVVREYGGGAENRFLPATGITAKELDTAVAALSEAALSAGDQTEETVAGYRDRLRGNASFRSDEWTRYADLELVPRRVLPAGTVLYSQRYGAQRLVREADGYIRAIEGGRQERFDDSGKLVRVSDKNNNFIRFAYDARGRIRSMTDNDKRTIEFTVNDQGRVVSVRGTTGEATYKYANNDLIESVDVEGGRFLYTYDTARRHNLKQITYADGTTMKIEYFGREQHENVASVTERDGSRTEYAYTVDPSDKDHFTVKTTDRTSDGEIISTATYEYFLEYTSDGREWTRRLRTNIYGEITDTTYTEAGLPATIEQNGEKVSFAYDAGGRVTRKETPDEIRTLEYDKATAKATFVSRKSKTDPPQETWSRFAYDPAGNLLRASNSEDVVIHLTYDKNGRIDSLRAGDEGTIRFQYNAESKPTQIALERKDGRFSAINVTYANGEIEKVESDEGRAVGLEVMSAFQKLLDVIRPAGVTLSF